MVVGAALEQNNALKWLDLAANGIENRGAVVLAEGLVENAALEVSRWWGGQLVVSCSREDWCRETAAPRRPIS